MKNWIRFSAELLRGDEIRRKILFFQQHNGYRWESSCIMEELQKYYSKLRRRLYDGFFRWFI